MIFFATTSTFEEALWAMGLDSAGVEDLVFGVDFARSLLCVISPFLVTSSTILIFSLIISMFSGRWAADVAPSDSTALFKEPASERPTPVSPSKAPNASTRNGYSAESAAGGAMRSCGVPRKLSLSGLDLGVNGGASPVSEPKDVEMVDAEPFRAVETAVKPGIGHYIDPEAWWARRPAPRLSRRAAVPVQKQTSTMAVPTDVRRAETVLPEPEATVVVAEPAPVLTLVPSFVSEQPVVVAKKCQCKSDPKAFEDYRKMDLKYGGSVTVCECERIEPGCEVQTKELKASISQLYQSEMVEEYLMERGYGWTAEQQERELEAEMLKLRLAGKRDQRMPERVVKRDPKETLIASQFIAYKRQHRRLPSYLRYTTFVPSRFA